MALVSFVRHVHLMAQTTAPCQENEVLLEIQISHQPVDFSEDLDFSIQGPFIPSVTDASNIVESFSYTQRLLDNGTMVANNNLSLCVPEDQCLLFVAKLFSSIFPSAYDGYRYELPPDEVSIIYNGQVWSEKRGPIAFSKFGTMIVAELGPCEVVCEPEDALLDIEAVTGYTPDYDWQILDDATGQIIQHCPSPVQNSSICYWESEQYYHERLCLPRAGCYTLLVAERSSDIFDLDAKSLHVYYDGNHIESFEYLQFINVALSDGSTVCDSTHCDSDSTLVELYFFRQDMDVDGNRNLTWSLSTADGSPLGDDLGMGIITSSDRSLYYHKECISKVDSCIQLATTVTQDTMGGTFSFPRNVNDTNVDDGAYQENVTFRFVVDGIIYSDRHLEFGYIESFADGVFKWTHDAGDCSSSQICAGITAYHAVQVDFRTEPTWQIGEITYWLSLFLDDGDNWIQFNLGAFYPNQKYRFFSCMHESWFLWNNPNPEYCAEFSVSDEQFINGNGSYNISINDRQVTGQPSIGQRYNNYGQVVTHIAGECKVGSLSKGARVGVIVGCVVAALFVIIGGMVYYKKSKRNDPDTTSSIPQTTTAIPIVEEQYPMEAVKNSPLMPQEDFGDTQSRANGNALDESDEAQA